MPILTAVAVMKDQAYHLYRHIWNEVMDDWTFFTDQEKQILKRYVFSLVAPLLEVGLFWPVSP